jgi:hypothetical protein
MSRVKVIAVAASFAIAPAGLLAQSITLNQVVSADTFVSSGQPTANFGTLGAMEIAVPTAAQGRTEETLMQFNTAALKSAFDADFGAGAWTVTSVTLSLFSNVNTAGQQAGNGAFNKIAAGGFEFDLLSDNNWSETAVTWNSLPSLLPGTGGNTLTQLGVFNWAAAGAASSVWTLNTDPNLINEIANGGAVTIFGQPTAGSTVGYLFNQAMANPGYLNVTATAVPEPRTIALIVTSLAALVLCRCR